MSIELKNAEEKKSDLGGQTPDDGRRMPSQKVERRSSLGELFAGADAAIPAGAAELEIRQVACDSRKVRPRALFFALHGAKADGNTFIRDAVARGAAAIASEDAPLAAMPESVIWVRVPQARKALATAAANFFGQPGSALKLAGVTGTNGKTTTTSLIDSIIRATGEKTGLFGTIAYHTPLGDYPAPNTTPESVDLQGFLAEIRDAGGRFAVLEASSHSLAMDRLWACHFAAAVFTNLTREHMDYHKTFEDYFNAKLRLFQGTGAGAPDAAIVNVDDEYGKRLAKLARNVVTYGLGPDAELTTKKFQLTFSGLTFTAQTPRGNIEVASSLVGRINVYNILAAIGAAQALGLDNGAIANGIRNLKSVSGRFQPIAMGQPERSDQAACDGRSERETKRPDSIVQRQSKKRGSAQDH
jgi:UDP-N-acetylmuramoyl-L-alanyl-D-glutamate--2,6-diaminopimelate ligase